MEQSYLEQIKKIAYAKVSKQWIVSLRCFYKLVSDAIPVCSTKANMSAKSLLVKYSSIFNVEN